MGTRDMDPTACPTCCTPLGGRRVDPSLTQVIEREERARLRPLLERCLAALDGEGARRVGREPDGLIIADLWRELGITE